MKWGRGSFTEFHMATLRVERLYIDILDNSGTPKMFRKGVTGIQKEQGFGVTQKSTHRQLNVEVCAIEEPDMAGEEVLLN